MRLASAAAASLAAAGQGLEAAEKAVRAAFSGWAPACWKTCWLPMAAMPGPV